MVHRDCVVGRSDVPWERKYTGVLVMMLMLVWFDCDTLPEKDRVALENNCLKALGYSLSVVVSVENRRKGTARARTILSSIDSKDPTRCIKEVDKFALISHILP